MSSHVSATSAAPLTRHELHAGWRVRPAGGPVPASITEMPATVPGCVHTDLLAAGLIDDPYLDDNEAAQRWIGESDWTYETTFARPAGEAEHTDLVFDGLDTIATVSLNGRPLGDVDNMHRTWRFDVTGLLQDENTLSVAFTSPVRHASSAALALGVRPSPYPLAYNAIRKNACSFGWDWGIATATSGIWKGVRLETWTTARLEQVLVDAQPAAEGGVLGVRVRTAADRPLTVRVTCHGATTEAPATAETVLALEVPDAELWWPRGYGSQPRYDVTVTLLDGETVIDETTRRVGFRSARWDTTPDAAGTPFLLYVNERPVLVRGVNWIPDDALVTRVDRQRYETRLRQTYDAGVNLVRVWGGGIYESDDFYDLCDEMGLLTWQDMLLACAAYAEEEPLWSSIEAEARDNLARIGHHPSLVLICGNNENLVMHESTTWQRSLGDMTWGLGYYERMFPALVAEITPQLPYIPGSPFSPGGEPANAEAHGSMHIWDMWNARDWSEYRTYAPRFVAEFGWQGPPAWSTLERSLSERPLTPQSTGMLVHQKAFLGNLNLSAGLVPHLDMPREMRAWHWAMQLNQAWAMRAGVTWYRSLWPHCGGTVVWQINDCWPVVSWAAIDGHGVYKPLWYALRAAHADRLVTVQPTDDGLVVAVVNDSDEAWEGTLTVSRLSYAGETLAATEIAVSLPARQTVRLPVPVEAGAPADPASEVLVASLDGCRDLWFYAEPRDTALTQPTWAIDVADGVVRLTTDVLVRDLFLMLDPVSPDLVADQGLLTLLPGETAEIRVSGGTLTADDLTPEVVRTTNELVRPTA